MKRQRKHYDSEFKRMAVELVETSEKTGAEVARELGVQPDLVNRWRREYANNKTGSFQGNGNACLTPEQEEITRLKKELQDAKVERDILKKAVDIFSKSDGKSINS